MIRTAANAQHALDTEVGRLRVENAELRQKLGSHAPARPEPVSVIKTEVMLLR